MVMCWACGYNVVGRVMMVVAIVGFAKCYRFNRTRRRKDKAWPSYFSVLRRLCPSRGKGQQEGDGCPIN